MKKYLTLIAACAIALTACSSDNSQTTVTVTESATTSSSTTESMSTPDTPQCNEFCSRVDRIVDEQCEPAMSGAVCSDILTPQALLAMTIRDSESATPGVQKVASDIADTGSKFANNGCHKQAKMDLNCSVIANTIHTQMTTLQLQLHTS